MGGITGEAGQMRRFCQKVNDITPCDPILLQKYSKKLCKTPRRLFTTLKPYEYCTLIGEKALKLYKTIAGDKTFH